MAGFRDLPISRKLVLTGVAASLVALVVSTVSFLTATFLSLRTNLHQELRVQAAIVSDNSSAAVAFEDRNVANEVIHALHASDNVDIACLFDGTGHVVASYARDAAISCPATPPADGETDNGAVVIVRPVMQNERRIGTLFLRGNLNLLRQRLVGQAMAALAGMALGIGAAVLLSSRLQRVISQPVLELSSVAARISKAGDYTLRAHKRGDDEIGELVETFNGMVTEVERRDEQLRAASRLKDEFLAALSHELRTPLNAVLGWIQVLRAAPADPPTIARAYESIERNARAQASLIEDLLDISRIVTGKLHFTPQPVDLVAVVDAALEVIRAAADAKAIVVRRQLLPSPQLITGDANRLQQVVWNLLSNAVKFTSRGGHVEVSLEIAGQDYVLSVTDDGIGIAPGFLPHVFDRFRQADGSMTRPHGGLGLGLAIARDLTELHGGHIRVTSPGTGRGSTFIVSLPQPVSLAALSVTDPVFERTSLAGLSVLVIDDDEDTRDQLSTLLTRSGATARTAASATEAFPLLIGGAVDVILCDLAMPDLDGFELIRQLGAYDRVRGRVTPAVAVSAHAGVGAEAKARESGFHAFVSKPYSLDTLFSAIQQARATAAPPSMSSTPST